MALFRDLEGRHWGYETSRQSRIRSGVMYPVLQRMLEDGWLADGWEDHAEARRQNRPPRRYYEVTDRGRTEINSLLARARQDGQFDRLDADVRAYVASRSGGLITTAEAAAKIGVPESAADYALRVLSVSHDCGELTRREGGWVYRPPDQPGPGAAAPARAPRGLLPWHGRRRGDDGHGRGVS